MMENKYISVSALNRYLQYKIDNDLNLQLLYIRAEISNIRLSNGIMYFVLKDDDSEIDAIMFKSVIAKLKFTPIDGTKVLVKGKLNLYVKKGRYSVNVFSMEEAGLGQAYLNFLYLKEKLEKEGLFSDKYKLPIPKMSEKIGVITSSTGDALHDIVSTVQARFPIAQIYLYPALVQGSEAPKTIISSIQKANKDQIVDVIILGRGGGSIEDLSCFNDEALARTIVESKIPIVSAIGHEADYTICDFVSSLRAPTPTGGAVLVTRNKNDLFLEIGNLFERLNHTYIQRLIKEKNNYEMLINSYGLKNFSEILYKKEEKMTALTQHLFLLSPQKRIDAWQQQVEDLYLRLHLYDLEGKINDFGRQIDAINERMLKEIKTIINLNEHNVATIISKLILLNPLNIMQKGYLLGYQDDKLVKSINDIDKNKVLKVAFYDGSVDTVIKEVKK